MLSPKATTVTEPAGAAGLPLPPQPSAPSESTSAATSEAKWRRAIIMNGVYRFLCNLYRPLSVGRAMTTSQDRWRHQQPAAPHAPAHDPVTPGLPLGHTSSASE